MSVMRLPVKIGIIVTGVAVPAGIFFIVLVYGLISSAITTPIEERQLVTAEQTMDGIDRFMLERLNDLRALSQVGSVTGLVSNPADKNLQTQGNGRLRELAQTTGSWERLDLVGPKNNILASTNTDQVGQSLENLDQDVIQKALAGENAYSDAVFDPDINKPTLIFALPVKATGKQTVDGAIVGHLAWADVIGLLKEARSDSVNMFNKEGFEIANKDGSAVFEETHSSNPAIAAALAGQEGSKTVGDKLISYTTEQGYKDYVGNGWVLAVETPTSVSLAPATDVAIKVAAILSLSIFAISVALIFLIGRTVRPITTLTQTANRLALGDLTQRVPVTTNNEVGELGTAFNNMADKLQQLYKNLEAKVQQKTAQLAKEVNTVEAERAKDEAILTSIGEGIIAVDPDGVIVKINQPAEEILGMENSALLGKKLVEALPAFDQRDTPIAPDSQPSRIAIITGKRSEDMFVIHRPDGGKVMIDFLATPIVQQGKVIGVIIILRDVTKEREVDRMKTEFISLASHQLRTPLSAIKWFSEMMISGDAGKLSPEQQDFTKNIYDSTERMIDLVNSLLNISRIESGRIIVDPKPTDLHELVSGIINDLKAKTAEKQQTLLVSVHKELPKINLDPHLIGQVYLNFLTNAIKYTPRGGEISVFISRKDDQVVSQITDNGYGIPKSQQDKVFKKFFRAENIVKVETDGTGLGLYLVKAIIESSGGKVWFKSEEGKGTSFWFSIPMSGMKAKAGEVTLDI